MVSHDVKEQQHVAAASFDVLDQYADDLDSAPLSLARLVEVANLCSQRKDPLAEWPKTPNALG